MPQGFQVRNDFNVTNGTGKTKIITSNCKATVQRNLRKSPVVNMNF